MSRQSATLLSASFLVLLAVYAVAWARQAEIARAYVVEWNGGDLFLDNQGRTNSINVSPDQGSTDLSFITTEMPPGSNILVHRHLRTEEVLFVHRGSGVFILGDQRVQVQEGSTIYVPKGTWHGLENPHSAVSIVEVVTPPGLEKLFRGFGWPPGAPPKEVTAEQAAEIERESDSYLPQP